MESHKVYSCECGENKIRLHLRHCIPGEVIDRVFCPECIKRGIKPDKSWPIPGEWSLHFNLEVAQMFAMAKLKVDPALVNPGFLMDGGYVE